MEMEMGPENDIDFVLDIFWDWELGELRIDVIDPETGYVERELVVD